MSRRKSDFITEDHSVSRTIIVVTEKQRSLYIKKKLSGREVGCRGDVSLQDLL
jgi:hypothetical protein